MKFLNNIDLQKNEIQNFRVQNLPSAPSNPVVGQHYFDTVEATEYVFDGTTWQDALNQGKTYTFSTGLVQNDTLITLQVATDTDLGGVTIGENINVDAGNISVSNADKETKGVIQIATDEEAAAGTEDTKAVTAKQVEALIQSDIQDNITLDDLSAVAPIVYEEGVISANIDEAVTAESDNLISSGAVSSAIEETKAELQAAIDEVEAELQSEKISQLTDDTDENPIKQAQTLAGLETTVEELNEIHDSGVTTDDLVKLTEITVTSTEINYLDGVTSNVQDQLDSKVEANEAIEAATHTKITYDEKGLVTAGEDLTADDIPDLSDTYVNVNQLGVAGGVATLDSDGLVPAAQLPSYVDDVIDLQTIGDAAPSSPSEDDKYFNTSDNKIYTYADGTWVASDPEVDKIYVDVENNMSYRWSGTTLVQIGADKLLGFNAVISGDGSTTTFDINHNLGTRNVVFEIYEAVSPYEKVYVQVLHSSTTAIQVIFATAPESGTDYNVTVIAIG